MVDRGLASPERFSAIARRCNFACPVGPPAVRRHHPSNEGARNHHHRLIFAMTGLIAG